VSRTNPSLRDVIENRRHGVIILQPILRAAGAMAGGDDRSNGGWW
jgi:hypothetical protein